MTENLPIEIQDVQSGEVATIAREQSEIQSAIITAKKFPRNEAAAFVKINKSLERPKLAEAAIYSFKRGKKPDGTDNYIEGPSVDLARELARCWGNIRFGLRVVAVEEEAVHIKGYAYDVEANNYVEAEDKFKKLVQRKVWVNGVGTTQWVQPDERDLRELINRKGAILVRNCILQVVPSDLIADAVAKANETFQKANAGELETNRDDSIKKLSVAFDKLGVSVDMLNKYFGHDIAQINAAQLAELKRIWKALANGEITRESVFEMQKDAQPDLNGALGIKPEPAKPKKAKKPEPEAPPVVVIAKQEDPKNAEIPIG